MQPTPVLSILSPATGVAASSASGWPTKVQGRPAEAAVRLELERQQRQHVVYVSPHRGDAPDRYADIWGDK
jgi:hypothetical protein